MTLDTNILIAYLDGEEKVVMLINRLIEEGRVLFLPAAVEIEILSFAHWKPEEVSEVRIFLEKSFIFVPIDRAIAQIAAKIRRNAKVKTPDATIAATALSTYTPLLTRNVRDFKKIPDIDIQTS